MRDSSSQRLGFTLIEALVVLSVIGILAAAILPAIQQARSAARRTQCASHLRQLSVALHNYHDVHSVLPPGSLVLGPSFPTATGWGWGAMLLPHVEQATLYRRIDFDVGTAVGTNAEVIGQFLPLSVCPADSGPDAISVAPSSHSSVQVACGNYVGVEGVLAGMSSVRFSEVTDGLSKTLFLGERVYQSSTNGSSEFTSAWCGFIADRDSYVFNSIPHLGATASQMINLSLTSPRSFSSRHSGGAQFAFGDGAVQLLSESIDVVVFSALGTPNGGEVVQF